MNKELAGVVFDKFPGSPSGGHLSFPCLSPSPPPVGLDRGFWGMGGGEFRRQKVEPRGPPETPGRCLGLGQFQVWLLMEYDLVG